MPQTRIQGKFYPLTSEITSKLRQAKLTAAEWRIWSYLVEIDPWGDRYQDIDSLDVMSKCDCSRATFYRAIAKFQKLGIFDIQDKGFSIRNLSGASQIKSSQAAEGNTKVKPADLKTEKSVSETRLNSQNCESDLKNEKSVSKMRLDSQICENQPPGSPPDKNLDSPQTLQTYSDFKKTLSESERENFLDFVRKKTENLEKPINDLEAWLASKTKAKENRWEIYYRSYQEEKTSQRKKPTRQGNNSGSLSPSQVQRAIAEFKKQRGINQPVDEPEPIDVNPEDVNSESARQREAEFNRLLDNPPEREVSKSPAQQRRENMAKAKRQQQAIERANREAAEERARQQQQFSIEERQAQMQRQIEEFNQRQPSQNPEITEEGLENE